MSLSEKESRIYKKGGNLHNQQKEKKNKDRSALVVRSSMEKIHLKKGELSENHFSGARIGHSIHSN
jgi:hypothetical protein